jgi:phosphatidylinositol alpha-1,6-mannosyltransferase
MHTTYSSPKVLLLASIFPPIVGGSANVYASLCQQLGTDAFVLAPSRRYTDGTEIAGWQEWDAKQSFLIQRIDYLRPKVRTKPPTRVQSLSDWIWNDRRIEQNVVAAAKDIIRSKQIDVLCVGELYASSAIAQRIAREANVPVIFYIHGEELTCVPSSRRYVRNARHALQSAAGIIAVSAFTRDQLLTSWNVNPSRVHVITNGVDPGRLSPGERCAAVLDEHRLTGKRILLTVGRLVKRKGHDTVIRALPNIADRVNEVAYVIVGDGPEKQSLKHLARECGVEHRVVFATGVNNEDLIRYYRSCHAFIMPNRTLEDGDTEGFGLVFLEAGACGKPVVAGRSGGVPDAVTDGDNGLLVDGSSVDAVATAAIKVLQDQQLASELGSRGRVRALRSSWAEKAAEFRQVCECAAIAGRGCSQPLGTPVRDIA